jgi:hypothetical protein
MRPDRSRKSDFLTSLCPLTHEPLSSRDLPRTGAPGSNHGAANTSPANPPRRTYRSITTGVPAPTRRASQAIAAVLRRTQP